MLAVAVGLALSAGAANAAIISQTYSVVGSNFTSTTASPYASITETFTITFDNTKLVSQQTTGITLGAPSTITPASALAFTYVPIVDSLVVGGTNSTVTTSDPNSADFAVTINNASNLSGYGVTALSYSVGNGSTYTAQTFGVAPVTTVPEPASLALIGSTFVAAGFLRRRKAR